MTKDALKNGFIPDESRDKVDPETEETADAGRADAAAEGDMMDAANDAGDESQTESVPVDVAAGEDEKSSADGSSTMKETKEDEAEPSVEELVIQLQAELMAAVTERDAAIDKMQRTAAEYQNVRKRQEAQLSDAIDRANKGLISRLLTILDDFELAFQNVPETLTDEIEQGVPSGEVSWVAGFQQIHKKLLSLLEEQGVTRIEATGEFDPMLHEAVLSEPSEEVESGHIISVLRTGYEYKGQVLRAAMVRVAA